MFGRVISHHWYWGAGRKIAYGRGITEKWDSDSSADSDRDTFETAAPETETEAKVAVIGEAAPTFAPPITMGNGSPRAYVIAPQPFPVGGPKWLPNIGGPSGPPNVSPTTFTRAPPGLDKSNKSISIINGLDRLDYNHGLVWS